MTASDRSISSLLRYVHYLMPSICHLDSPWPRYSTLSADSSVYSKIHPRYESIDLGPAAIEVVEGEAAIRSSVGLLKNVLGMRF